MPEVPANSTKLGEPVDPREADRTPPEPCRSTPGGPRQRPPTVQTLTGRSSPETGANSAKPGSKVRPLADLSGAAIPGSIDPREPEVRAPDAATPESIDPRGAEIRAPEARKAKLLTGRNSPKKRANSIKIRMPVETCPLCLRMYGRLSQHLILTHKVENKEERRLLLAIESGRINARAGNCPIVGCGKFSNRLDRHIRTHSEISAVAQDDAILRCKRRVVISKLTALRASNPAVPMVSTLDLEEHQQLEGPDVPPDQEELEEEECSSAVCMSQKKFLRSQVADLNKQVDILTDSLKNVTRRYRMLKRKSTPLGAVRVGQVARKLLSSLGPEEEDVAEEVLDDPAQTTTPGEPSTSQQPEDRAEEPSTSKEQPSSSTQEPREKSPPQYPDHVSVLNEILEEYRRHHLGPDPTTKLRENVGCQIYRIKKFIAFMAEGKGKLADFCFLNETAKLHAWVSSLRKSNMTVTTIQHYVMNVGTFFSYIAETPPPSCRLSRNALIGLRREILSLRKSLKRGIALHRTSVRAEKEVRVIAKSTLLKCRTQAMQAIPELLTLLENNPSQKVQWQFYGHFAALLSSIYGHRGGVFQNITIQEVLAAQKSTSQKAYLINVTSHKTNQAFGPAQIALTEEEYGWVQRFLRLKDQLPGGTEAKYFFFTSTPNPCKNLNNYFQEAWKSMGLPGCPTFTDIRTSIASHAKFTHSNEDRLKISKFMCHDVKTADKFYVTNLSAHQAMEHRRLFESALEGPERSPTKLATPIKRKRSTKKPRSSKKPPPASSELTSGSTTPEETEVRYQESGTSSPESVEVNWHPVTYCIRQSCVIMINSSPCRFISFESVKQRSLRRLAKARWKEGRKERVKEGWKQEQKEGRKQEQKEEQKEERELKPK
ncbi:hypothetical protein ROHU_028371 [Labeo rohita]|uniref:Uncharacterized protein n=1 Tax=Labeo rohita TaxID=84645 RepID=A0A498M2H0_LABRO|nr:hypothetical protein ROHU_028371 [Labeo rohita]